MKRYLLLAAAAAVIAGLTAVVLTASAQSVRWTGQYYIAVDEAFGGPAASVGRFESWSDLVPIRALGPGEFVDVEVRRRDDRVRGVAPDNRYDILAIAHRRDAAYSVAGYENEAAPVFESFALPIPGIHVPQAIAATTEGYLVVGSRQPGGPDLTGDYAVAYGTSGKWGVAPGPDFRGGAFVDLAISPHPATIGYREEIAAVGILNDAAVLVRGYMLEGRPVFEATEPERLPYITTPIAIEWAGAYYVVMGLDANGTSTLVFGRPGAWSESKMQLGNQVALAGLAVAPIPEVGKPGKRYDLLAIGRSREGTVVMMGEELAGQFPMLVEKWSLIPGFGILGGAPMATIAPSAATVTAGPNPFTHRSTVTLSVDREQPVLVEVFDAIGRRVTVLHNAMLSADTPHSFTLDAAGLPGGVYHFRVSGVDFNESRQVTLVR